MLNLLLKKQEFFSKYEELTQKAYASDVYSADSFLILRDELIPQIDLNEAQINELLSNNPRLASILSLRAERDTLSPDEQELFDISLKIHSCILRIKETDDALASKMNAESDYLQAEIKKENQGQNAATAKYSNAYSMKTTEYSNIRSI